MKAAYCPGALRTSSTGCIVFLPRNGRVIHASRLIHANRNSTVYGRTPTPGSSPADRATRGARQGTPASSPTGSG
jgi:hypothetical protein